MNSGSNGVIYYLDAGGRKPVDIFTRSDHTVAVPYIASCNPWKRVVKDSILFNVKHSFPDSELDLMSLSRQADILRSFEKGCIHGPIPLPCSRGGTWLSIVALRIRFVLHEWVDIRITNDCDKSYLGTGRCVVRLKTIHINSNNIRQRSSVPGHCYRSSLGPVHSQKMLQRL